MLNSRITQIIESLKLSESDRNEVKRLVARPEVQAVLAADEGEQIAHRKILIAEMAALPESSKLLTKSASDRADKLLKKFELAEIEYKRLRAELATAQLASTHADYSNLTRGRQIERELLASADPRIAEYRHEIGQLVGRVRSKCEYWQDTAPKSWTGSGGEKRYFNNIEDVKAASVALDGSLVKLRSLELAALTTGEISRGLEGLSNVLKAPLAALEMHPPVIDVFGKVRAGARDGSRLAEVANV